MVGVIIPEWMLWSVFIYAILNFALSVWKQILKEKLKKETKKLVENQKLIKELRETIEAQHRGSPQVGGKVYI